MLNLRRDRRLRLNLGRVRRSRPRHRWLWLDRGCHWHLVVHARFGPVTTRVVAAEPGSVQQQQWRGERHRLRFGVGGGQEQDAGHDGQGAESRGRAPPPGWPAWRSTARTLLWEGRGKHVDVTCWGCRLPRHVRRLHRSTRPGRRRHRFLLRMVGGTCSANPWDLSVHTQLSCANVLAPHRLPEYLRSAGDARDTDGNGALPLPAQAVLIIRPATRIAATVTVPAGSRPSPTAWPPILAVTTTTIAVSVRVVRLASTG